MDATTFDVIPTEDGMGYFVRLCREGDCKQTFVSSMHLVEEKRPQLETALTKTESKGNQDKTVA